MEELGKLPAPALITFGAVLAFIFAVRYLGLWQGQNASPAKTQTAVAAVIVDPTALNRLTDVTEKAVDAISSVVEVGESLARSHERMAIELDRIREELRIQREVERRRS